jgi:hypothetical protein
LKKSLKILPFSKPRGKRRAEDLLQQRIAEDYSRGLLRAANAEQTLAQTIAEKCAIQESIRERDTCKTIAALEDCSRVLCSRGLPQRSSVRSTEGIGRGPIFQAW